MEQMTLFDGRILSYADYGPPDGIPVIGLHGMPGSRLMMRAFEPAAAAAGIRLIAPERPGYGLSSPQPRGSLLGHQRDVAALADRLGFDQYGVLGVSGGGPYALACAHELPDRLIAAAVVSGIGPLTLPNSLEGMVGQNQVIFRLGRLSPALTGRLLPLLIRLSLSSMEKLVRQGKSPIPDVTPEMFAAVVADQSEALRMGGRGVTYDLEALWRPWGFDLAAVRSRVFLWHGADDNMAPARLAREVAARLPNVQAAFIPGESHTGPLTRHAAEILQAFC